jgi:deoxyribonucleoside regulator
MDPQKHELAIRASILYYEENCSQDEIARQLGISRSYISQLLSYAREHNIVKIQIEVDEFNLRLLRKEIEWKKRWPGLKQVFIMKSVSPEFTNQQIGKFAAPYISELINKASMIGVGLGTAVMTVIDSLAAQDLRKNNGQKIVQIMGGLTNEVIAGAHPNELVKILSSKLQCDYHYLNCPAVVEDSRLSEALSNEPTIANLVKLWGDLDLVLMGIGPADGRSTLVKTFSPQMRAEVENRQAVGEININFYDAQGCYLPYLENNRIAMSMEQLKRTKNKVIIGYGEHKVIPLLGALRGGLIDILITDSFTAEKIEAQEADV